MYDKRLKAREKRNKDRKNQKKFKITGCRRKRNGEREGERVKPTHVPIIGLRGCMRFQSEGFVHC